MPKHCAMCKTTEISELKTYCPNCLKERKRASGRKYSKENRKKYKLDKELKSVIQCKCPKCEKKYEMTFFYTGPLPARKYCEKCLIAVGQIGQTYTVGGNKHNGFEMVDFD